MVEQDGCTFSLLVKHSALSSVGLSGSSVGAMNTATAALFLPKKGWWEATISPLSTSVFQPCLCVFVNVARVVVSCLSEMRGGIPQTPGTMKTQHKLTTPALAPPTARKSPSN